MKRLKFEKVYLDTNAIIHAVENFSHAAREILRAGASGNMSLFTSTISLHETLIGPLHQGSIQMAAQYHGQLSGQGGIEMIELDEAILTAAAHLRASNKRLDLADALHLASAEAAGCEYFVSNDAGLDAYLHKGCERLGLEEIEVEPIT